MNRVREYREKKGMRREDLASQAGISFGYVRVLEESEDPPSPSVDKAQRIAKVLGAPLEKVFPLSTANPA